MKITKFTEPPYYEKALMIDIDGTIIIHGTDEVIPGAVEWVNSKHNEGYAIFFFTSRLPVDKEVTEELLNRYGFTYNAVIYGKPYAGQVIHIDDRVFKTMLVPRNIGVVAVDKDDLK